MTIIELLKMPHHNLRISHGDTWLYWDEESEQWVVRMHKPLARKTVVLYEGNESSAVEMFIKAAGIEVEEK